MCSSDLNATSNSPAPINYSSTNKAVVTIDDNGTVTIVGSGSASITLSQDETPGYTSDTTTTSVIIISSIFKTESILQNASSSNITAYPQNLLNRSTYYRTMFDTTILPYNKRVPTNFMSSKGTFIYKPHTGYGSVGRSSSASLACRKRL